MNQPNRNPGGDRFSERMRWGVDVGAFDDVLGESLQRLWHYGVVDPVVRQLADDVLRPFERRRDSGELPPFKASRLSDGELILGQDVHGRAIRYPLRWLHEHLFVVGNTGAGKTTLLCLLVPQLAALGCAVWLRDPYKRQLRRLKKLFERVSVQLVILRSKDWRWNLLEPHSQDPLVHLSTAVDLLVRRLDLPPRAASILRQGVHALYRRYGTLDGSGTLSPTIIDLYEWVATTPGLNPAAREAILDRLGALILAATPKCVAWRRG